MKIRLCFEAKLAALGYRDDPFKCGRRVDRQLRQHLAVDLDFGVIKSLHKTAIRNPFFPAGRVDTGRPEVPDLALMNFTVTIGIRHGLDHGTFGLTESFMLLSVMPFGLF